MRLPPFIPPYIPRSSLPPLTSTSFSALGESEKTPLLKDHPCVSVNLIIWRPFAVSLAVIRTFSLLSASSPAESIVKSPPVYSLVPEFVKISSVVFAADAFPPSCIIPFCSIDKPPNVRVNVPDSDGESLSILSSPFEFLTVKTPPTEKVRVETYKDAESRLCAEGLGICESIVKSPPIFTSPLPRNPTRVMYQSAELRASEKRKSPRVSKTAPALI